MPMQNFPFRSQGYSGYGGGPPLRPEDYEPQGGSSAEGAEGTRARAVNARYGLPNMNGPGLGNVGLKMAQRAGVQGMQMAANQGDAMRAGAQNQTMLASQQFRTGQPFGGPAAPHPLLAGRPGTSPGMPGNVPPINRPAAPALAAGPDMQGVSASRPTNAPGVAAPGMVPQQSAQDAPTPRVAAMQAGFAKPVVPFATPGRARPFTGVPPAPRPGIPRGPQVGVAQQQGQGGFLENAHPEDRQAFIAAWQSAHGTGHPERAMDWAMEAMNNQRDARLNAQAAQAQIARANYLASPEYRDQQMAMAALGAGMPSEQALRLPQQFRQQYGQQQQGGFNMVQNAGVPQLSPIDAQSTVASIMKPGGEPIGNLAEAANAMANSPMNKDPNAMTEFRRATGHLSVKDLAPLDEPNMIAGEPFRRLGNLITGGSLSDPAQDYAKRKQAIEYYNQAYPEAHLPTQTEGDKQRAVFRQHLNDVEKAARANASPPMIPGLPDFANPLLAPLNLYNHLTKPKPKKKG